MEHFGSTTPPALEVAVSCWKNVLLLPPDILATFIFPQTSLSWLLLNKKYSEQAFPLLLKDSRVNAYISFTTMKRNKKILQTPLDFAITTKNEKLILLLLTHPKVWKVTLILRFIPMENCVLIKTVMEQKRFTDYCQNNQAFFLQVIQELVKLASSKSSNFMPIFDCVASIPTFNFFQGGHTFLRQMLICHQDIVVKKLLQDTRCILSPESDVLDELLTSHWHLHYETPEIDHRGLLKCLPCIRLLLEDGRIDPTFDNNHAICFAMEHCQSLVALLWDDKRVAESLTFEQLRTNNTHVPIDNIPLFIFDVLVARYIHR